MSSARLSSCNTLVGGCGIVGSVSMASQPPNVEDARALLLKKIEAMGLPFATYIV